MSFIKKIVLILALVTPLHGCFFVAGAAAGAAAVAVVYDHRSMDKILLDQQIANVVYEKIHKVPALRDQSHIEVTSFNQVLLIVGETPNPAWRQQAEDIARTVPDVQKIYNQITIQGPSSSLTRASDGWITTKIKSEMLATKGLHSGTIKVVVENGVVYLMGIVTRDQAETAVDISRRVTGVQKVVKIFRYTD